MERICTKTNRRKKAEKLKKKIIMSIYFRSSLGIAVPKSPYIGQIYYDPDLKRTFRYEEKDFGDCILKSTIDWFHWVDITEKAII